MRVAVTGVLKGYDQLLNLVLDETLEYLRGAYALYIELHSQIQASPNPPECEASHAHRVLASHMRTQ